MLMHAPRSFLRPRSVHRKLIRVTFTRLVKLNDWSSGSSPVWLMTPRSKVIDYMLIFNSRINSSIAGASSWIRTAGNWMLVYLYPTRRVYLLNWITAHERWVGKQGFMIIARLRRREAFKFLLQLADDTMTQFFASRLQVIKISTMTYSNNNQFFSTFFFLCKWYLTKRSIKDSFGWKEIFFFTFSVPIFWLFTS